MKTYAQLSETEKDKAVQFALTQLLQDIIDGTIRFNDRLNHNTLQKRINSACKKADRMQTPWFTHEYILDTCREDLEGMAHAMAEDTMYSEPEETVVSLTNAWLKTHPSITEISK